MKTITVNIKDEYMEDFLTEMEKFIEENCDKEQRCVTIFGLSIEDFRKAYKDKIHR